MKILVFTTLYPNCEQPQHGLFIERRVLELRSRNAWEFEVVAPVPRLISPFRQLGRYPDYEKVPALEVRENIRVHHPRYPVVPGLTWRIAPLLMMLGSDGLLRQMRRTFDFNLIDAHFAFPDGVAATMLGRRLNVPVLITARGSDVNDSPNYLIPRLLLKSVLRGDTHWIAVSRGLSERVSALAGDGRQVPVFGNGVDMGVFYPMDRDTARRRYGLQGSVILSVGNLRRLKGHHLAIKAISNLDNVTLVIAGGGSERQALERQALDLGIGDRVRFLGVIDNSALPELYSAADVFVLASSSEGCPNVILEAMACGTPIVATAVGAIPDLLPEVGQTYLVRERTADELQKQIARILKDIPISQAYVARARQFSWDATCVGLAKIMRKVANL